MNIPKAKKSGLSMLLGNIDLHHDKATDAPLRLVEIPVEQVCRNESQPRTHFDSTALVALASSIEAQGMIQPIVVRELVPTSPGRPQFQIIAGERRWLASQQAGLRTVPAIVQAADDQTSLVLALAENLVRENLNPLETARCYATLVDEFSMTIADIAQAVGKSRPAVSNTLRLLELPDDVIAAIEAKQISEGHGRALLQLDDRPTQRRMAREAVERALSVRALEFAVRQQIASMESTPKGKQIPANSSILHELDSRLSRLAEQLDVKKISARSSSRSTVLEIRCHDQDQLVQLLDLVETVASTK